jgi:hypothetical protein
MKLSYLCTRANAGLLGLIIAAGLAVGCAAQVDFVDAHGYHHHGYYDDHHDWHGGYYDGGNVYHDDPHDWHQ